MKSRRISCRLLVVCLISVAFFSAKLLLDNKYTAPGPQARGGFLQLSGDTPDVIFLRDGWEFFQYQALTPNQLATGIYLPTCTLTLGRYAFFDLGDPNASPFGSGTYRLTLITDGTTREYMLELPEIYTSYDLYINGSLKHSTGSAERLTTLQSRVTFEAEEMIDIVFVVEGESFWGSGMVYPPAFGAPLAVERLLDARLILASAACALALLTAALHLVVGVRTGQAARSFSYGLLCCSLVLCIGRIPVHAMGLGGLVWYRLEAVGTYGLFFALLLTHGHLCPVPTALRRIAALLGAAACIWAFLGPNFAIGGKAALLFFSRSLDLFRWGASLYLIFTTTWFARTGPPRILTLAYGYYIFGIGVLADRLLPLYEPCLFFWPIETAGFLLVLLLSYLLGSDAVNAFRDAVSARAEACMARRLEAAQQRQFEQLIAHNTEVRRLRHELRNQLLAYQQLLLKEQYQLLSANLAQAIGIVDRPERYSSNPEVNSILCVFSSELEDTQIVLDLDITPLPHELPLTSADLCSLLLNLLENAKEACLCLPDDQVRRIHFCMGAANAHLLVSCTNPYRDNPLTCGTLFKSSKKDKLNHGFGMKQIDMIVKKHLGYWTAEHAVSEFEVNIVIPLPSGS